MGPTVLDQLLRSLPRAADPNLLVGFDHADDAGVYCLTPELALVQTVDFFSPIVDEPETFGAIAAANALSDVYAMGGTPLTALSIAGFPEGAPPELLSSILLGGLEKLREANCTLVGGHTVRDEDLKFGYSITGTVHPGKVWSNAGARTGDALFLTKALGTGVIATAARQQKADPAHLASATASMRTLNAKAAALAAAFPVHAATDVTGFGLLGHLREMALGSGRHIRLEAERVPLLPGARSYALAFQSKGLDNNRSFLAKHVDWGNTAGGDQALQALLLDPQTSGGLVLSVAPEAAADLRQALSAEGVLAARIGEVLEPLDANPVGAPADGPCARRPLISVV